jgi:hypothetical protein
MSLVALKVLSGILLADFLTAATHWVEDTYLPHTRAPGVLGSIARDNDMHHFIPFSITAGSWWDNVKVSAGLLAVVALGVVAIAPRWAARHRVLLASTAAAMAVTNLLHRFQHERECSRPRLITALQRAGVLESSHMHAVHHRRSDVRYSVLLGFTNAVYDTLGVWRGLEAALGVAGIKPSKRKPGYDAYKALYDDWLRRNMARRCPQHLTPAQMDVYHNRLEAAYSAGLL